MKRPAYLTGRRSAGPEAQSRHSPDWTNPGQLPGDGSQGSITVSALELSRLSRESEVCPWLAGMLWVHNSVQRFCASPFCTMGTVTSPTRSLRGWEEVLRVKLSACDWMVHSGP